jgi:hypothetical protein
VSYLDRPVSELSDDVLRIAAGIAWSSTDRPVAAGPGHPGTRRNACR